METGTFLNADVQSYINQNYVPLQYESGRDAEQFHRFGITATPTHIILNAQGDEIHRSVGFKDAKDFIAELEKGRGTTA